MKFKSDLEINFWMNIYSKGSGSDDVYHDPDDDPAAECADKAIRSLRKRMPDQQGNAQPGNNGQDAQSFDRTDGRYHNAPK